VSIELIIGHLVRNNQKSTLNEKATLCDRYAFSCFGVSEMRQGSLTLQKITTHMILVLSKLSLKGASMYQKSQLQQLRQLTLACALVSFGAFSVSLQVHTIAVNSNSLPAVNAKSDTSDKLNNTRTITKVSIWGARCPGGVFSAWNSLSFYLRLLNRSSES
jgi:hypothetical protein